MKDPLVVGVAATIGVLLLVAAGFVVALTALRIASGEPCVWILGIGGCA